MKFHTLSAYLQMWYYLKNKTNYAPAIYYAIVRSDAFLQHFLIQVSSLLRFYNLGFEKSIINTLMYFNNQPKNNLE